LVSAGNATVFNRHDGVVVVDDSYHVNPPSTAAA
jgi:hypothetical protein